MDIASRLKRLRKIAGLTQLQLAEKIGVAQNSIQKIESGDTKNPRNIESLAHVLNCSPEYLQYGVGELDNASYGPSLKKTIPLINFVQAGSWHDIGDIREATSYYNSSLVCPVNCSDLSFALRVQGVSMEPKFFDGDLIFVDPESAAENGSFVVARLDDENQATFKQLIIEGGKKYLKPVNPNWPDQLIPINGNCTIVGKVVFTGKEL